MGSSGVKISSNTDGVYILRAFSGGGWDADSSERTLISSVPNGDSNDKKALALNIVSPALDLVSLAVPLDGYKECLADTTITTIDSLVGGYLAITSLNDILVNILPDTAKNILSGLASCAANEASKDLLGFIVKIVTKSTEKAAEWFSGYEWLQMAGTVGEVADRGTKLFYDATPLESYFVVVGSPFASDTTPPSTPTNLAATAVSASQINLTWTASTDNVGVSGYNIYRNGSHLKSVTTTNTSDTGLIPSTQYCYTVSAYDVAGNESAQSSSVCATTQSLVTGSLQGYVKDAVTSGALSGVTINVYDNNGALATTLTTDSSGVYAASLSTGTYSLTVTKTGYLSENISNVSIQENVTTTVETVLQVSTEYSGTGTISGTIKNALDGTGASEVSINFRSGINVFTGTILATATTDSSGGYSVSILSAGNYTGEAVKSGYTSAYFTATVIGGQTNYNQDATITPVLSSGETRIVLTWGSSPSDLDSHLTGPISGSSDRFHVYYSDKGSSTSSPYAALDVDDMSSYGPETTTIYQQIDGTYRYSIHDYSNKSSSSSTALSNSSAQVTVYRGSSLVATFNVPANQGGTLWTVFEMNGDTITPINTMSYESSSSSVRAPVLRGSQPPVSHSDATLMRNLPAKNY